MNAAEVRQLADEFGTPLYLVDAATVIQTLASLRDAVTQAYPRAEITYPLRANYLAGMLRRVLAAGFRLDVASRHELALAELQGGRPEQMRLHGTATTSDDLEYCDRHGIEVCVDSLEQLERAAGLGTVATPFRLGIEVAKTLPGGAVSRSGLDFDDQAVVERVREWIGSGRVQVVGLRLASGIGSDGLNRLDELARRLGLRPEYLAIGDEAGAVGRQAAEKWGTDGPRLVVEAAVGVLTGAMQYVTRVTSVKGGRMVVCDGSLFEVNPLRSEVQPQCELLTAGCPEKGVALYGSTGLEIDQLGVLDARPAVGDLVVCEVGAYALSLAPQFVLAAAPVYEVSGGELLRTRQNEGDFAGAGE